MALGGVAVPAASLGRTPMILDARSYLAAVDRLYAAALDPAEWDGFLGVAATMFKADNAYVSQIEHQSRTMNYVSVRRSEDAVPVTRFPAVMDADPRMPAFRASRTRPVHCRMAVTDESLHQSRTYREYLSQRGIEYTMVVGLPARAGVTNFIGLTRGKSRKAFDDHDCGLLAEFVPHLSRSFAVRQALDGNTTAPAILSPPIGLVSAEPDCDYLRHHFGLAPAQARLTVQLMSGRSVKESADALGITEDSARQYLKRVFRRTGARRQADLVRIVNHALTRRESVMQPR
jgi:DNA-binding CsgD family transcriptional regulator